MSRSFFAGFLMADCLPTNLLLKPLLLLGFRLYVAQVFFLSGLTKIQSWSTTLTLFEYEYSVPLLPSNIAAYLGTATELIIPVLLALGLFTRPAALILFVFNIVAVIAYADISPAGVQQHITWGVMMAVIFVFGAEKLSLDKLLSDYLKR
jgi:putative oxidoreductase